MILKDFFGFKGILIWLLVIFMEKKNEKDMYASTKKSTGYYYDVTPPTYSYQNFYDSDKKQNSETSRDNSGSFFSNGGKSQIFVTISFVILICQIFLVLQL